MESLFKTIHRWYGEVYHHYIRRQKIKAWLKGGNKKPTPHYYKVDTILSLQKKYRCKTLIETGTYKGAMVSSCLYHFDEIVSIELDGLLYQKAVDKFRPYPWVKILQGDSTQVLPDLLQNHSQLSSVMFWLDGHYSEGITAKGEKTSPILEELLAIKSHQPNSLICIDDYDDFGIIDGYPFKNELVEFLDKFFVGHKIEINQDIMVIHTSPKK